MNAQQAGGAGASGSPHNLARSSDAARKSVYPVLWTASREFARSSLVLADACACGFGGWLRFHSPQPGLGTCAVGQSGERLDAAPSHGGPESSFHKSRATSRLAGKRRASNIGKADL